MKKIVLLFLAAITGATAMAQVTLTGTSYTENFDNLATGFPTGWNVYTGATDIMLGTPATASTAPATWGATAGGFKNFASADGLTATTSGTVQDAATDRALGVRQTGSFGDPGAAFVLQIANTNGLGNFAMDFKLQSLDASSTRTTTWSVDYGFGASPTFTTVAASGVLTTGNSTFSNNTVSVNFGTALNTQPGIVWIRIVTLTASTGSNNRPTTAIDDVMLNYTTATPNYKPNIVSLSPADNSTNIAAGTPLMITFDRNIMNGTGFINITNETANTTNSINVTNAAVTTSGHTATITGAAANLIAGANYHVTFDSTAFDTATFKSYGIYDTTAWSFSTVGAAIPTVTFLNETFNTSCGTTPGNLPMGWLKFSVTGTQEWNCTNFGFNNTGALQMNGFQGTNNANEDWLITPHLDLSAMPQAYLEFRASKKFNGDDIEVLVSTNYAGSGNPNLANWTSLNVNFAQVDSTFKLFNANLTSYIGMPFYVAFKYTSTATNGALWKVDDVKTTTAPNYRPDLISMSPADNATSVPAGANLVMTFDRTVTAGTGQIHLHNSTTATVNDINATSADVTISGNVVTVTNTSIAAGNNYYVMLDSTAFDTAGYKIYGIYDQTTWNFSADTGTTGGTVVTSLNENFDASCGATPSNLPMGWSKYSVTGTQQWNCTNFGYNATPGVQMNGFQAGNNVNEDWLFTPRLNLSALTNAYLQFRAFKKFSGDDIEVLLSTNYSGMGDPNMAGVTWTNLNVNFSAVDTNYKQFQANLTPFKATPFYVAFKYVSTATNGSQWKLDNILVSQTPLGINETAHTALPLTVVGNATQNAITIAFDAPKAAQHTITVYDLAGRILAERNAFLNNGTQHFTMDGLNLTSGMYLIQVSNGTETGIAKAMVF